MRFIALMLPPTSNPHKIVLCSLLKAMRHLRAEIIETGNRSGAQETLAVLLAASDYLNG